MSRGLPAFPVGLPLTPHLYPLLRSGQQPEMLEMQAPTALHVHAALWNFTDHLYAFSCPLISCSVPLLWASGGCPFNKSLLSGSAGEATPSSVSQIMYFIYFHLSFYRVCPGAEGKAIL